MHLAQCVDFLTRTATLGARVRRDRRPVWLFGAFSAKLFKTPELGGLRPAEGNIGQREMSNRRQGAIGDSLDGVARTLTGGSGGRVLADAFIRGGALVCPGIPSRSLQSASPFGVGHAGPSDTWQHVAIGRLALRGVKADERLLEVETDLTHGTLEPGLIEQTAHRVRFAHSACR